MSQKNETLPLILALLITAGILGGAVWWFTRSSPPQVGGLGQQARGRTESNAAQTFAKVNDVPSGLFSYGGSTTWAPLRAQVDSAIQTVWPQFKLRYTQPTNAAPGSGTGIKMLLDGQLAFAQSSRPLKPEEYQTAQDKGFQLKEIAVAIDGIAIAVHPDLDIPGLTISQLKDIYTGKITNWSQVNGPNIPIIPYSRRIEEGGTIEFFVENVLGGDRFGNNIQYIPTTTQALKQVSENPGSIYYASAPEIVPQCTVKPLPLGRTSDTLVAPYREPFVSLERCPNPRNELNGEAFQNGDYPITRRLFVIVRQNGQADERAGEAYAQLLLTDQGQNLIDKAGFVRIR
ncbi:MAG: PstS family phosphate ABC transporter substrate-binding protein [Cyanobacteriota bacterium]|nr:PstS family phosphate ABC transporter substrate-binding protein [Cyanobacteriota bacterium]